MKALRSSLSLPQQRRLPPGCGLWRLTLLASIAVLGAFGLGLVTERWAGRGRASIRVTFKQSATQPLSQPAHARFVERQLRPLREGARNISMHTVFMTGCDRWQDWEAAGLYWSFLRSGQPGEFTRLMGCGPGELLHRPISYSYPVWVTYGVNLFDGDTYNLYNKPWVLAQWFKEARPKEEYFLVLDADMIIRRPFLPEEHQVGPGWAAAQNIWYLTDLNNAIAGELFPQLSERKGDWNAHPGPGRVADEVAEFYFMHRKDAPVIARLYWEHTRPIRAMLVGLTDEDKLRRNKTTGQDWVAETHAYPIAAALANVWHHGSNRSIYHIDHQIWDAAPLAIHYCWATSVAGLDWSWYKHQQRDFDFTKCPPWGYGFGLSNGGLFSPPPRPSQLTSKGGQLAKDLLNIEVVATLNQAFCHLHHYRFCPRTEQLLAECGMADQIMEELDERWQQLEMELGGDLECLDAVEDCTCEVEHPDYVPGGWSQHCRRSCGQCTPKHSS